MTGVFNSFMKGKETSPHGPMEIGTPFNFQHVHNVRADPRTSTGFSVRLILNEIKH